MNRELKDVWLLTDHEYDPYGSAMTMLGVVAGIVWSWDPNDIPPSWGYSPGMLGVPQEDVESAEWGAICDALPGVDPARLETDDDQATRRTWDAVAELVSFGNLLSRYIDLCKANGRDY